MLRKSVKFDDGMRRFLYYLFTIQFLISSCTTSMKSLVTKTVVATPVFETTATQVATTMPSCKSGTFNLNELLDDKPINSYLWSENRQYIYIQSGDNWWKYSVKDQELKPSSDLGIMATRTPLPVEQTYRSIVGNDYELLQYKSSLSPNGNKLIYWYDPSHFLATGSTPIPDLYFVPNENFGETAESEDAVFLLQEGKPDPVYLGSVKGGVIKVHWFADGDRAILEMLRFSPYYLWLVNIPMHTLTPLLSREEVSSAQKFSFLDISPDGNSVMYQTSIVDYVFIKNINDFSVQPLHELPRSVGAWWLPDGKRIIAVRDKSVFLYDMNSEESTRIASNLMLEGTFSLVNALGNEGTLENVKCLDYECDAFNILIINLCFDLGK